MFVNILIAFICLLAIWAFSFIFLWGMKAKNTKESLKYFWQMNGIWNVINLLIITIVLIFSFINANEFNTNQSVQEIIIWTIALNILLDLGYVTLGLLLESTGKRKDLDKYKGYGMSIQLQGAFLFFFDTVLTISLILIIV